MALSRAAKEELVDQYEKGLATAPNAFLLGFRGLSVPQATELRKRIRETGARYEVVKNTLAARAVEGKALEGLVSHFTGTTAVAYTEDDPVVLAKALTDFSKDVPAIEFKAGLIEGQEIAAEQCKEIANLPGRDQLVAKLVFLLQSPISRFVRGLAAIPQQFVSVLDQVRQQKEGQS